MPSSLDSLIIKASDFINSEFNLKITKSKLHIYDYKEWKDFYEGNKDSIVGLKKECEGLYIPKNYCAYTNLDSPNLISNIFHEFFGHGLFCEQSQIGKRLVDIIQNNQNVNQFLYEKVDLNEQILGLIPYNIYNYEGFALWLESLLCHETNNSHMWYKKIRKLPNPYIDLYEFFTSEEQRLTRFGFMSQLGFPKFYDNQKIISFLKHFYNSNFKDINFIVLYGSRKPESDIDLFIVYDKPSENFYNGWLDIFQLNKEEFIDLINKLDISVTDPLFSGELIYGDKNYFECLKQKVKKLKINEEQILHNSSRAEKAKYYLANRDNSLREEKIFLSYLKSYAINAEELKKGYKLLTLQSIKERYGTF